MKPQDKQPKGSIFNDLDKAISKLRNAVDEASYEIQNAGGKLTKEDIGELYAAYSEEDESIYISNMFGSVEFQEGWTITFPDFAKKLWEDSDADMNKLADGLRLMADLIEKWERETPDKGPDDE
jgi:hypothetical protein